MRRSLEQLPPHNILVVDPHQSLANELGTQLRKKGHTVEIAYDWPSAVKLAPRFMPAIAIINLDLPGEDAITLARYLWFRSHGAVVLVADGGSDEEHARADQCRYFNCHLNRIHGIPLIQYGGETVKLADRSPEDWTRDVLQFCPQDVLACRVLEAVVEQFEPAELAPLIPHELLAEVRKYAESGADLRSYLAGLKFLLTDFSEHWADAVKGAWRWFQFFNP
jgi:CheY-like chemotaxis protein